MFQVFKKVETGLLIREGLAIASVPALPGRNRPVSDAGTKLETDLIPGAPCTGLFQRDEPSPGSCFLGGDKDVENRAGGWVR